MNDLLLFLAVIFLCVGGLTWTLWLRVKVWKPYIEQEVALVGGFPSYEEMEFYSFWGAVTNILISLGITLLVYFSGQ